MTSAKAQDAAPSEPAFQASAPAEPRVSAWFGLLSVLLLLVDYQFLSAPEVVTLALHNLTTTSNIEDP